MNPPENSYAIACSFNESFALPAAVALRSVSIHWSDDQPIHVFILDGGVTETSRPHVEQSIDASRMRLHWCPVYQRLFHGLPRLMHRNLQSIYRFAIAEVFPSAIERVV